MNEGGRLGGRTASYLGAAASWLSWLPAVDAHSDDLGNSDCSWCTLGCWGCSRGWLPIVPTPNN